MAWADPADWIEAPEYPTSPLPDAYPENPDIREPWGSDDN